MKLSGVKRGPELSMADKYVHEHTYPVNICEYGLIDALNKKRTCVDVYMLPFKLYMMKGLSGKSGDKIFINNIILKHNKMTM